LDALSGGRVIFAAGLGGPIEDEYASFGEPTDPVVLAELLDEGLDLLQRYWSGRPVDHDGRHYQVRDVTLLPATVQRPRPPVWIAGFWPNRPPMRRAARWDGAVPLFNSAQHGHAPDVDEVRDLVAYVRTHRARYRDSLPDEQRDDIDSAPFEMVLGGASPAGTAQAHDLIGPLIDAGATWWDERQLQTSDTLDKLAPILHRVEQGPPAF
jgi:alkanesulfonate monooxygenase SsuD/methylene tetrahydromethanopterin reductase-like flavin-dependent oxidoreductase (luciferase family)